MPFRTLWATSYRTTGLDNTSAIGEMAQPLVTGSNWTRTLSTFPNITLYNGSLSVLLPGPHREIPGGRPANTSTHWYFPSVFVDWYHVITLADPVISVSFNGLTFSDPGATATSFNSVLGGTVGSLFTQNERLTIHATDYADRLQLPDAGGMLEGARGNDVLLGGSGIDEFAEWAEAGGQNTIRGGAGSDILWYGASSSQPQNDVGIVINGGVTGLLAGDTVVDVEYINGTDTADDIRIPGASAGITAPTHTNGYGGNDRLVGNSGNNDISGGLGDDTIYASAGNDRIWGGASQDQSDTGIDTVIFSGVRSNYRILDMPDENAISVTTIASGSRTELRGIDDVVFASGNFAGKTASQIFAAQGQVAFMARLANAAYHLGSHETWSPGFNARSVSADDLYSSAALTTSLTWLTGADLPGLTREQTGDSHFLTRGLANGIYTNGNAAALVGRSSDALFISFRGTNDNDADEGIAGAFFGTASPDVNDWDDKERHYALLQPLIDALDQYVADGNGVNHVYVTGHSLGAAMVQHYMQTHAGALYEAMTFANPGYGAAVPLNADPRQTDLWLDNDPIRSAAFFSDTIGEKNKLFHTIDFRGYSGQEKLILHSIELYRAYAEFLQANNVGIDALRGRNGQADFDEIWVNARVIQFSWSGREFAIADRDDNIIADSGADLVLGGAGNDTLNGGSGSDRLIGGIGNDSYYVDNSGDIVTEGVNAGFDTVRSTISYVLGANIESLQLTGLANANATGNGLSNILVGNTGNNILDGGGGADTMTGGYGDDIYVIDNLNDVVIEIAGQGTKDRFATSISTALKFDQSIEIMTVISVTATNGISLIGNAFNQAVTGNNGNNAINGAGGTDVLTGNGGADAFYFTTALGRTNIDTITDFNVQDDHIRLENAVFTSLPTTGILASSAFWSGAAAHDASDRIIYNAATGDLFYDADGTGAAVAILFAKLTPGLAMTNADFLIV